MAAVEADRVLVAIEADTRLLDTSAKSSAQQFDRSMSAIEQSAVRAEKTIAHSTGNTRVSQQILQHVIRGSTDQFSAGTPILQVFTTHLGMIAEAGQFAGGSMGKFGAILGGPWGIAATAAITIAATLGAKLLEGGEDVDSLVEKMREHARQTKLNDEASAAYAHTLDGLGAAIRAQREEQEKSLTTDRQAQVQALALANARLAEAQANRISVASSLADAQRELATLRASQGGPRESTVAAIAPLESRIASLQAQLSAIDAAIGNAAANIRGAEAPLIQGDVEAAFDKRAAAVKRYTTELGNLNTQLQIGAGNSKRVKELQPDGTFVSKTLPGISDAEYRKRLTIITAQRDAAIRAAENHQNNNQIGNDVSVDRAAEIVRGIGGQVNSGYRSKARQQQLYDQWVAAGKPSDNPVAPPGTSAHERGKALDVQMAPGISIAKLREAFAAEGVHITKAIIEKGHYHIEWGTAGPSAEELARLAKAAAAKAAAELETDVKKTSGATKDRVVSLTRDFQSLEAQLDPNVAAARSLAAELQTIEDARLEGIVDSARAAELRFIALRRAMEPVLNAIKRDLTGKPGSAGDIKDKARDAEERSKRRAEDQIYDLANLYETLFTDSVKGVWDEFKREGLRALAILAAQETFKALTGRSINLGEGRGGGSSIFSTLLSAATAVFGGGKDTSVIGAKLGARASGGPVSAGGAYIVGERGPELLQMGAVPGHIVPNGDLAGMRAASQGGGRSEIVIHVQANDYFDARVARVSGPIAAQTSVRVVQAAAPGIVDRAVGAMPGRLSSVQKLGS